MNSATMTATVTIPQIDLGLLQEIARRFGWTLNKAGIDEALDDVREGRVHHADSAEDLIKQCLA